MIQPTELAALTNSKVWEKLKSPARRQKVRSIPKEVYAQFITIEKALKKGEKVDDSLIKWYNSQVVLYQVILGES